MVEGALSAPFFQAVHDGPIMIGPMIRGRDGAHADRVALLQNDGR
jgi:hypothetical protein